MPFVEIRKKTTLVLLAILIGVGVFAITQASFNPQINYQGKLTDTNDVAVTDGDYNFEFKLWSHATSTATSTYLKWTETCTSSSDKITVTSGLFSHLLGSVHSFSADDVDFNRTLWLEVSIAGTTTNPTSSDWETLSPRKKLGAVPAAFVAEKIGDYGASSIAILSESETITGAWTFSDTLSATTTSITASTSLAALTVQQDGSGNIVDIKNATGTVFKIASDGTATLAGDFLPATTTEYDLGSSTSKWANLYAATTTIGDTITISSGDIKSNTLLTISSTGTTATSGDIVLSPGTLGSVGIGTTTPSGIFSVATSTGASVFYIGNDGNVGIGTASPTTTLQVVGTSTLQTILPQTTNLYTLGSPTYKWAKLYAVTTTIGDTITIGTDTIAATSTLTISSGTSSDIILSPGQYIGIGTSTPSYSLHVWGSAGFGTSSTPTLYVDSGTGRVGIGTTNLGSSKFKVLIPTSSDSVTDSFTDQTNIDTTTQLNVDTAAEEVKLATTTAAGFCISDSDKNTTTTLSGDVVYCDNSLRMWSITANVTSTATTYAWGGYGIDEPTDSCILVDGRPACNYCDNLTYAGYSDWELPSCVSGAQDSNCILYQFGIDACGSYPCTPSWDTTAQSSGYWSSTESSSTNAYYVHFSNGNVFSTSKSNYSYVRCVRGQ